MSVSSTHSVGRTLFKYLIAAAVLLAAAWLFASSARAEAGLTVEVVRNQNLLVATAMTVEGDEVVEDSWQWAKDGECSVEAFEGDSAEAGSDFSVVIDQDDLGATYCFYVEDSADRQAVGSIYVHYPKITVRQNNDQLVAEVANLDKDGIDVDESSWGWFRYQAHDSSRFGCEPQHFDLDDVGLTQAAEAAEGFQAEMYGAVQVGVYELQQDVYRIGQGSTVSLTTDDEGVNFCFRVSDTAGITNYKHITVGPVTVDDTAGSKPASGEGTDAGSAAGEGSEGAGQVSAGDNDNQDDSSVDADDEGGNVIRNIGLALLAVAIIIGIFMLIRRSQNTSDDEEDIQV
ncbi:hypothetical protein F4X86_03755 [Candidatus Saccharibacteria bacterium]|nr:hypothetical protein [Candidatus Saccharibacteria bacterium]